MIVKVPPPRRDGNTDFKKLKEYMTEGLTNLGADARMVSFDNLTQYITTESALSAMGDQVEKTIAVEIGNLTSLSTAPAEMWSVAQRNARCKDPVYHYILSWPESERPPVDEIMIAARNTLAALGLKEHQYIVAIHANTDNLHAHIEVNRVHPRTFKAQHLEWAHKTLHKAARETEIQFGWSHDNGLWQVIEVDGQKLVVPNTTYVDPDIATLSTRANRFETWNGLESFEGWCQNEPAKALRATITSGPVNWQSIHQTLAEFGIELQDSGGGGLKVVNLAPQENDKFVGVAASKAFRFLKRKELEKSLGAFEARDENAPIPTNTKTYKRDPVKRLVRREERRAERDALFLRFSEEKKITFTTRDTIKGDLKHSSKVANARRFRILKDSYTAKRAEIKKATAMTGSQKQQAYMLLRLSYLQSREALKDQIHAERRQINEMLPKLKSWRAWVEEQAQLGDGAAISALRGMVYEEKRQAKEEGHEDESTPSIRPVPARPGDDPTVMSLRALTWRVSTNGRIFYQFNKSNDQAFIDEGSRLTFGRPDVTDEALLATIRYAKLKWGTTLHISGGDGIFRERLLRIAATLDMTLDNQELQSLQQQLQTSKARHIASNKPRVVEVPPPGAQSLFEALAGKAPGATVVHASTQDKTYKGRIESTNDTHVLQAIGKGGYVLHEASAFGTKPLPGVNATIRYRSGKGEITQKIRGKGR